MECWIKRLTKHKRKKTVVKKKIKQKEYNIQGFSCEFTTFITHLCCVKNGSNLTPIE